MGFFFRFQGRYGGEGVVLAGFCVGLCAMSQVEVAGRNNGRRRGRNQGHLQGRFNSRGHEVRYGEEWGFYLHSRGAGELVLYI